MTTKPIIVFAMLGVLVPLIGCQTKPEPPPSPAGPMFEGYSRPRNPYFLPKPVLALESGEMQRLTIAAGEIPGQRPLSWYDSRNDGQRFVQAGFKSSTLETVYTQTYDRQYQHGGQVRDHFSQTTRRGSISETVR